MARAFLRRLGPAAVVQGQPSTWEATFSDMATNYPDLEFIIAEYNPERAQANLIMKNLPDGRGPGTFFWEPTLSGEWGNAMFSEGAGQRRRFRRIRRAAAPAWTVGSKS